MSTCSKNKYEYGELATRNTQGCSGSGKDPGFNPGKAGLDLFRRPSLLSCFKSVYLFCECVITDGFLIDKVLTLASRLLKNMLFKITNSRRLQIGTVRFYLFFNFGRIEVFSGGLISHSDGWFYIQSVCNSCLVEHEASSQGD